MFITSKRTFDLNNCFETCPNGQTTNTNISANSQIIKLYCYYCLLLPNVIVIQCAFIWCCDLIKQLICIIYYLIRQYYWSIKALEYWSSLSSCQQSSLLLSKGPKSIFCNYWTSHVQVMYNSCTSHAEVMQV